MTNADTDLYVSPYIVDGAGGPGSSFTTIQAAVTQAIADGATSTARSILIRPGTYTETFSISTASVKLNFIGVGTPGSDSNLMPRINGTVTINGAGIYTGFQNLQITTLTYTTQLVSYIDGCRITTINANSGNTYTLVNTTVTTLNYTVSAAAVITSNCTISTVSGTDGLISVVGGRVTTCTLASPAQADFYNCGANFASSTGGTIRITGATNAIGMLSGSATITQIPCQQGNMILSRSISASDTATSSDYCIEVNSSGGAVTVTVNASTNFKGFSLIIKDVGGAAASNNITITPTGKTIDGVASKVISSNYGALTIFYNGTNFFTL